MDGLQALQGLRSVTEAGLNYVEYSRRILDGKVQVDRYVNAKAGDIELRKKMAEAMEFYLFAGDAWNAKIRKEYDGIGSDPRVDLCPLLRELRDRARGGEYISVEQARGISVAVGVSTIWSCASAKIREVEETLSPDKT